MNEYFLTKESAAVDSVLTVAGFSFGGHGQSSGLIFVRLAGSGGQNAIGTGTIGGMLSATFLAIFFVPLFFVATLRLFKVKPKTLVAQMS